VLYLLCMLVFLLAACRPATSESRPTIISASELEAFADSFFPARMEEYHIPGVVFVFVQDRQVILAKGYGYADLAQGLPVSPKTSVMRIGSISKSFVATAVMQLVERGKLDLHTDINQYLTTFQLEDTFPSPVTLAHLLTHTAGFEDPLYFSQTDPTLVQPLGSYLATSIPARKDPVGEVFRYSNHGYALAAFVVEEVSGIPFDEYVSENIFKPLAMYQSRYLVAPPVPEDLATGYFYSEGEQIAQPVDYDNDYPGGSIISTAEDMSHFLLAQLADGCYQEACILQAATLAGMHQRRANTPYQEQNMTYGFVEGFQSGERLIGHSGAIRGFGNILDLLPEHHAGYFISFNEECYQTSACEIISSFRQELVQVFFSE